MDDGGSDDGVNGFDNDDDDDDDDDDDTDDGDDAADTSIHDVMHSAICSSISLYMYNTVRMVSIRPWFT